MFYGMLINQIDVVIVKIEVWFVKQKEVKIVMVYIGQGVLCFYLVMGLELFDLLFVKIVICIDSQEECDVLKQCLCQVVVDGFVFEVCVCVMQFVFGLYLLFLVVYCVIGLDVEILCCIVVDVWQVMDVSLMMCMVNMDWGMCVLMLYFILQ